MTIRSVNYLKEKFSTGCYPVQQDFYDWIESMFVGSSRVLEIESASDQITPDRSVLIVNTSSGNITLTSNPQILQSENSAILILVGNSDTDYVSLVNGNGLMLNGNYSLKNGKVLILSYLDSFSKWVEVTRTSITSTTDLTEGTNLYFLTSRARSSVSGTAPIGYSSSTGEISFGYDTTNFDVAGGNLNIKELDGGTL